MNNTVFGKNNWKCEKTEILTERRRNYLVSQPIYHTKKSFTELLLAIEVTKAEILMNRPVYLELSILELSKISMYGFWYDYEKPKYGEKAKLYYGCKWCKWIQ